MRWLLLGLFVGLTHCGEAPKKSGVETALPAKGSMQGPTLDQTIVREALPHELISVPVSVKRRPTAAALNAGLDLTALASQFTITLSHCASGHNSTATEASSNLQVYKYDTGCLAKLTAFTLNGLDYVPSGGSPFTTWQAGDSAIFQAVGHPTEQLTVIVVTTVASPVTAADSVNYQFSDIEKGTDLQILQTVIGAPAILPTNASDAPSFKVDTSQLVGFTAGGGLKFVFKMECTQALSGNTCINVDLANIQYLLVEDTYGGSPAITDLETLFSGGGDTINLGTDELSAGAGGTVNGGFVTTSGANVLASPDNVQSHNNMLLVLQNSDQTYQYFTVKINISGN